MIDSAEKRNHLSSPRRFASSIIVAFLFASLAAAQKSASDLLENIPQSARTRLLERLDLLVEYQREAQYDKQFDLITDLFLQGVGKNEFIRNKNRGGAKSIDAKLVEFVPRSATGPGQLIDGGQWQIFGCGLWLKNDKKVKHDATVIAVREKGDWYFSEVTIITSIGGPAESCRN